MKTLFEKRTEYEIDYPIVGKPKRKYRKFYFGLLIIVWVISMIVQAGLV